MTTGFKNGAVNVDDIATSATNLGSATGGTSNFVTRDANGNAGTNNFVSALTTVASSGGTTTLNPSSTRQQVLTGTLAQTYKLPTANSSGMNIGATFEFDNNSTGLLTINNANNTLVTSIAAGGYARVRLTDNSTSSGVWDYHFLIPANSKWTTSGLYTTALNADYLSSNTANTALQIGAGFSPTDTGQLLLYTNGTGKITLQNGANTTTNAIELTPLVGGIALTPAVNKDVTIGTSGTGKLSANLISATTITAALTGNASTATTLQTARNINGVSFNGSADITVTAAAGTLTGSTLASGVTASSLTSVGTLTGLTVTNGTSSTNLNVVSAGASTVSTITLKRPTAAAGGSYVNLYENNVQTWAAGMLNGDSKYHIYYAPSTLDYFSIDTGGLTTISTAGLVTAPTITSVLNVSSSTQASSRITLSGQEFSGAGNTSTDGLAFLLGINRNLNKQLWIADSSQTAVNSSNTVMRIAIDNTGHSATIDALATDGATGKQLNLNSQNGAITTGTGLFTTGGAFSASGIMSGTISSASIGALKLANGNNQAGDRWWMGFDHGTNLADSNDRARVGCEIITGGGGKLFFQTGASGTQTDRLTISDTGVMSFANSSFTFTTYSPTIGDGTNNFTGLTQVGQYMTIGNLTFFTAWVQWTGKGSAVAGSNLRISLPSTINAASARYTFPVGMTNGIGITTQRSISAGGDPSATYSWMMKNTTGTGTLVLISDCATAGEVQISGWYRT